LGQGGIAGRIHTGIPMLTIEFGGVRQSVAMIRTLPPNLYHNVEPWFALLEQTRRERRQNGV
jgi:hypothetical protein